MSRLAISLADVQQAAQRLEGVAVETPVLYNAELNKRLGARVFYKPESLQHIGAFKFRGAYNRLVQLSAQERARGVVAFSSGNHAQGIAYAARLLGMKASIVMPSDAPKIKLAGTEALGAEIRLYDRYNESREQISADIAAQTGAILVPAFEDKDIIAGQGSCGLELLQQLKARDLRPDWLLSPVGGGGLLAGVSVAVKGLDSEVRICAVEPENYDDHRRSRIAGERVQVSGTDATLCDSLMATTPGELTWSINSELVDEFVVVSEADVEHAISFAYRYLKLVVEPGGAVTLAALLQDKLPVADRTVAFIISGGNIDNKTLCRCLEKYPAP